MGKEVIPYGYIYKMVMHICLKKYICITLFCFQPRSNKSCLLYLVAGLIKMLLMDIKKQMRLRMQINKTQVSMLLFFYFVLIQ